MRLAVQMARLAGALALVCVAAPLAAQAVPVRKEPRGFDFKPNGAWRNVARSVRNNRKAALARGDLQFLNTPSASAAVTGDFKLPVVMLDFSDSVATTAFELDTAAYRKLFFSATPAVDGRPYSLKSYYEQMSRNNITIDGDVYGWVHTSYPKGFVGQGCEGVGVIHACSGSINTHFGAWMLSALDSLNSATEQVDWSKYDIDGDGFVDFVTFIHPTLGGECQVSANDVWAHRWNIASWRGTPYVTKTPWPGHAGQFMRIDDYIIQSARGGTGGCTAGSMMPVGTVAHETGHAFGIPDLYNTNQANPSEGVGEWSLMGSGNYTIPFSPSAWDGWSLQSLGWVKVDTLTSSRTVTLNPIQTSDTVLVAPITGTDQYLLLENRAFLNSDTAQMRVGRPITGNGGQQKLPGLLIWHIDQSIIDGGLANNTVNAGAIEGLHLMQADGLEQLHLGTAGGNRGDRGDSYPGLANNHALTYNTNPSATTNEGAVAGFVIDSIQQVSITGPVVFRFRRSAPYRVSTNAIASGGQVTVNGVTTTAFEDLFGLGDTVNISIADTQLVNSGRTQLAFQSWSDAGARVHQVISDGTPDTVTATTAAQHRVNFIANGAGSVGTSGPATNTFVAAGTPVTLTATPNGGNSFTNWTGDTSSSNAVIILPMGRPYSVTANFTGAVAVTPDQAANAILGVTPLTGPQATYLDAVGNNNGTYDLGDYLAYLKANAIVPAPGLLARVLMHGAKPLVAPTKKEQ